MQLNIMAFLRRIGKRRFFEASEEFEGAEMQPYVAIYTSGRQGENEPVRETTEAGSQAQQLSGTASSGSWKSLLLQFKKRGPHNV